MTKLDSVEAGQQFVCRKGHRWRVAHVDQANHPADAHIHLKVEFSGASGPDATYLMRAHEFRVLATSSAFRRLAT
jgi:hypothetical protein